MTGTEVEVDMSGPRARAGVDVRVDIGAEGSTGCNPDAGTSGGDRAVGVVGVQTTMDLGAPVDVRAEPWTFQLETSGTPLC